MNDDAPAADLLRVAGRFILVAAVVVNHHAGDAVPDADPELVHAAAVGNLSVDAGQLERVGAGAVDRALVRRVVGMNATDSSCLSPAFNFVPATGEYTKVPGTFAAAFSWAAPRRMP